METRFFSVGANKSERERKGWIERAPPRRLYLAFDDYGFYNVHRSGMRCLIGPFDCACSRRWWMISVISEPRADAAILCVWYELRSVNCGVGTISHLFRLCVCSILFIVHWCLNIMYEFMNGLKFFASITRTFECILQLRAQYFWIICLRNVNFFHYYRVVRLKVI